MSNAEIIDILTKAGIKLTGEEKRPELDELLAKHELTLNASLHPTGGTAPAGTDSAPPLNTDANASKSNVTNVVFTLNDKVIRQRVFSLADHGEDFLSIADQFAQSNAKKIRSREDL